MKGAFVLLAALCLVQVNSSPTFRRRSDYDTSTLKFLHFMHRHGDRTPNTIYPNDPYDESYWPIGLGELTRKGKRHAYELGRFIRERYGDFLNTTYVDAQYKVRSTDLARVLMTAETVLSAVFPPHGLQAWLAGIGTHWQPIPVHTVDISTDRMLAVGLDCPNYNKDYNQIMESPVMQHLLNDFDDLYAYLDKYVGWNFTGNESPIYASNVYDSLHIEDNEGLTLPEWTNSVYPQPLKEINDLAFVYPYYNQRMAKYQTGYLLYNIVENIRNFISGDLASQRVQHFATHDTTIAAFMSLLDINNYFGPPFASCLFLELHSDPEHEYVVKIFYRNDTTVDPYPMKLPDCDVNCPLADFYTITDPLVVSDPTKECYGTEE